MSTFDDLPESDDLDATIKAPVDPKRAEQVAKAEAAGIGFVETCPKCRGTGTFWRGGRDLGKCFTCQGAGKRTFKTSAAERAQNRASAAKRQETTQQLKVDAFAEAHPAEWSWITRNPNFEFAQKMAGAVRDYGDLTDGQMGAIHRCMQRDADRAQAAQTRKDNAQTVNMEALEQAFAKARTTLKNPKLRLPGFAASLAKPGSKNPGAIYIKADGGEYLGKVAAGKFICSPACTPEQEQQVVATLQDPQGKAIEYGRLTGSCSCCGRELTDPESVQRGIGPVCAENYGW